MRINITARHLKLTDAIASYVKKKITKISKLHNSDEVWTHTILSVEKNRQITEILFHADKKIIRAKGQSADLYASIDMSVDKLEKQLKKQKELLKVRRKLSFSKSCELNRSVEDVFSYSAMEDSRTKISEIKRFDLEPVSLENAIVEMDNLSYNVYMFKDIASDNVCVLYRNDSGSIVLLEPNEKQKI
ncbi:MAG: ribosome-associated translation inhibitor RaiA [Elusimicrobiota bacterium]|jgi:putative sigma-54 modulation protein|nr:ribosome-associated translation inhibitor RaiA [Elusimicrobiota bacterium]